MYNALAKNYNPRTPSCYKKEIEPYQVSGSFLRYLKIEMWQRTLANIHPLKMISGDRTVIHISERYPLISNDFVGTRNIHTIFSPYSNRICGFGLRLSLPKTQPSTAREMWCYERRYLSSTFREEMDHVKSEGNTRIDGVEMIEDLDRLIALVKKNPEELKRFLDSVENRRTTSKLSTALSTSLRIGYPKEGVFIKPSKPTTKQLKLLFVSSALPFVFFGFFDNAIMLLAGDFIDANLSLKLGISTLASAALGNTFGDVIGIWLGSTIESLMGRKKSRCDPMTKAQLCTNLGGGVKAMGSVFGVVAGCVLGMFPLIWPQEYRLWEPKIDEITVGKHLEYGSG